MRKKLVRTFILIVLYVLMYYFSSNPIWVEKYYTAGLYKKIVHPFFKILFSWIPISMGDILYSIVILYMLYRVYFFFKNKLWKTIADKWKYALVSIVNMVLTISIIFNLSWGLNYSRPGIAYQLQLTPKAYAIEDVQHIITHCVKSIAALDSTLLANKDLYDLTLLKKEIPDTYDSAMKHFPFLGYNNQNIKKSLFGVTGNYIGYYGYFNPFTHEAQVNDKSPYFLKPFTVMHEIAHQLGYANESEANFVSYLACMNSKQVTTIYAAHFEVLLYSIAELRARDSTLFNAQINTIPNIVKLHYQAYIAYHKKYKNPIEQATYWLYDKYLKTNKQHSGTKSYSELIGWLVAYYKQYGSYP